ncbi:12252_t:CDS:2, partial [Dentiscutata heterogama]
STQMAKYTEGSKEKTGTIAGEPSKNEKKLCLIEESVTKERL